MYRGLGKVCAPPENYTQAVKQTLKRESDLIVDCSLGIEQDTTQRNPNGQTIHLILDVNPLQRDVCGFIGARFRPTPCSDLFAFDW